MSIIENGTPAPQVKSWASFDFYRRLAAAERIAIRALANTDPIAADFMHTLDSAIASGAPVLANDADLLAGLAYLSATPAGSPAITPARVTALLST